ncbi:MAG: hypothetical protein QOF29_1209, partial [bacterium]
MRRRAIPVVAALATLAGAGPAGAAPAQVSIPGRFFAPLRVEVLAGESVTWTNRDFFDHDIAADDGSFGSAAMTSRGVFAHTFTATGVHTYYCRTHPTMRGQVDVFAFALRGPPSSVPAGRAAVLRGLAPAGTAAVTIERLEAGAFRAVAAAAVSPTGAFRATVVPAGPVVYRAVAGAATSASLA